MSHLSQIQNFLSDLFEKGDAHVVDPMFSQDFNKYLLGMPWCKSTNMRIDWDEIEQKKIIEVDSYGLVSI